MHDEGNASDPGRTAEGLAPHERRLSMFGRSITLPQNQLLRVGLGLLLCLGGLLWFLPVVGMWMLPLGLAVLSVDIPFVRRHSHRTGAYLRRRYPKMAEKLFPKHH